MYKKILVILFSFLLIFQQISNSVNPVFGAEFPIYGTLYLGSDDGNSPTHQYTQTNYSPFVFENSHGTPVVVGGIFNRVGPIDCRLFNPVSQGDFVFISSDIYIVRNDKIPDDGNKINDVNNGDPNTVIAFQGTTYGPETIGYIDINGLGGGDYSIIYDECQDGKYNRGQDSLFYNAFHVTGEAYTIQWPGEDPLPGIPPASKPAERAKTMSLAMITTSLALLAGYQQTLNYILKTIGSLALKNCADTAVATGSSSICSMLVSLTNNKISNLLSGLLVTQARNQVAHWTGVRADPPNPIYREITYLEPINYSKSYNDLHLLQSVITPSNNLTNELANENAILKSFVEAVEKYQGAVNAGDPEWAILHGNQIQNFLNLLINQLPSSLSSFSDYKEMILNLPNNSLDNLTSLIDRIKTSGFSIPEIRYFKNSGLNNTEIDNIKTDLLQISLADIPNTIENLDKIMKTYDELSDPLREMHKQIKNITETTININQQRFSAEFNNPVPVLNNTYDGSVGEVLVLHGENSIAGTPDDRIINFSWDLDGDGLFDDAVGPTPSYTYNHSFDGLIGLKVVNTKGISAVSYAHAIIHDNSHRPTIVSYSPQELIFNTTRSSQITFTIQVSDVDNDEIEKSWYLDNKKIVENENNYILDASSISPGLHTVSFIGKEKSSSNLTASNLWYIIINENDIDKDLWNSNIDCNDNNPTVNPETQEIRYNGIDDDCNPQTLDGNSPPMVQNKIHTVLQNSTTTNILLQGSDIDNDPLKFIVIDKPENGVVGPIITNSPSSASISYTPNGNFHGTDKLTFIANDGDVNSTIGTVSINIWILTSPLATSKTVTIDEDTASDIELEATNKDGHQLQFSLLPQTSLEGKKDPGRIGTLTIPQIIDKDSAITRYTPFSNYQSGAIGMGVERILFNVVDPPLTPDQRSQSNGQITININPVNDPPSSFSKIVKTIENTPIDIFLRANDVENDFIFGDRLNHGIKFFVVEPPVHGILGSIQENVMGFDNSLKINKTQNWVKYTPSPEFSGEDHFSFIASDGNLTGNISDIKILVAPQDPVVKTNFVKGDLLVNGGSKLLWLDPDGTANKKSSFLSGREPLAGGAFDGAGNVYIPEYNGGVVSKFNLTADLVGPFGDRIKDYDCRPIPFTNQVRCDFWPTAITFDKNGNSYIGGVVGTLFTGQPRDSLDDIRKFDSNGNLIQKFDVDVLSSGIFGLELDADQCTLYYSSWEGSNTQDPNKDIIKRFDVCENKQLTDFANIFQDPLYDEIRFGHQVVRDFKLLPDGGMIVAHNSFIQHLDNSGKIVKTYDIAGVGNWESIGLDADGSSFWAGGDIDLFKIDIATGKVLQFFELNAALPRGIMVYGEPKPSLTEISPMVIDQNVIVNQNVPVPINITGFDTNNDPLTFSIIEEPIFGTLSSNIDQITNTTSQVTYTPNPDFDGIDSFTFIANDGNLNSINIGTIVIARNHAPAANDDEGITTLQGVPVNIPVLANDTDTDIDHQIINDTISISNIDISETLGNVTLNTDNTTINYIPFTPEYVGLDSFNYTITDRYGMTDTAKVTINVLSSNNIPVAANQTTETLENTPKIIQLFATDADSNGILFYQIVAGPSNGFLSNFNSTTGLAEYHPLSTFHGEDSFQFQVNDGKDGSLPGIVNITVIDDGINDAPRVESERVTANVSQQITIDVLENDIDPNGDILTLTNITGPFNGTAFVNQDQTITYQSDSNFNASDVLYYRVADQFGSFDIGQLIIDVQGNAENQIVQVPSDRLVTTTRNQPIDIELEATATIDRPVTFFIVDAPENGTLGDITNISNLTSSIRYTPNNNFFGNDSFTYVAQDAKGITSNIGTIQISVNDIPGGNNPPIAKDSQVTIDEDNSVSIQLTAFDIDLTDSLTYSIESQPFNGKILSFDPSTGSLVYQPDPNFNGNDSFLFKAVDQGGLESNIATVQITVNSVNDPPVAVDKMVETNSTTPVSIILEGTDVDQGDTIDSFTIISNTTNGQIFDFNSDTGTLTYTPNNNFAGLDFFTFKVTDSHGLDSTNTGLVTINIKSTQEPPPNNEQPPPPLPSSVCADDSDNTVKPKGTQGNDELIGTSQRDVITGLGGNDRFNGCSGDDTLNGNLGNDGIAGGPGDDNLHGNEGNDYLQGDSGNDFLSGNEGNDILVGNEGRDTFFCGTGHDQILDFDNQLDITSNHCEVF